LKIKIVEELKEYPFVQNRKITRLTGSRGLDRRIVTRLRLVLERQRMRGSGFIASILLVFMPLIAFCFSNLFVNAVKQRASADDGLGFTAVGHSEGTEAKFSAILQELYRCDWQSWWEAPDPKSQKGYSELLFAQYGFYPGRLRFGPEDSIGNYVFTGKVKPAEQLTEKERMLLHRVALWEESGLKDIRTEEEYKLNPTASSIFYFLSSELLTRYENSGITTLSSDVLELATDTPDKRAGWVEFYEWNPRHCLLCLSGLLSPITGKPIRLDAKEFSPGNAYFEVITDKGVLRRLFSGERAKHFNPDYTYTYFRVYGEDSIIAEGIDVSRDVPIEGYEGASSDFMPCPSAS